LKDTDDALEKFQKQNSSHGRSLGPNHEGASVLLNLQAPIPSATIADAATTDSIQIFVLGSTPGTISTVAMKSRKTRVVPIAEIQYSQSRVLPSDETVCLEDFA